MAISAKVIYFTGEVKIIDSSQQMLQLQVGSRVNAEDVLVVTSANQVNIGLENGLIISLSPGESFKASAQDLTDLLSAQKQTSSDITTQSSTKNILDCFIFSHLSAIADIEHSAACTQPQPQMSSPPGSALVNNLKASQVHPVNSFNAANCSLYTVDSSSSFEKLFHCFLSFNPLPTAQQLLEIGICGITAENLSEVIQRIHLHKGSIRELDDLQRLVS
ncbi:MAG: hypothetical protein MJK10_18735 [Pseudomonadales bacterium]|nr:hypothetical protein [Pseudomonadales bacterium]NRA16377.1 hypothetical protein [Oceanospirillaceae bacterium]